jgi:hypothetical protein
LWILKNMVETLQTHVRPICVLLLFNYISRETEIVLVPQTHTYTLFVRPMQLSHKTTEALTDSSASKTFHE